MRHLRLLAALVSLLFNLAPPAAAWNSTGHRLIAAIAYDRLNPKTRARVDALIRQHPDYEKLFLQDAPSDPLERARAAFIAASVWPDQIKGDPRFYDETRPDAAPTPLLPGFPDMARHSIWHYYDTPYAPDGAEPEPPKTPNALSELDRIIPIIAREDVSSSSPSNPVYLLPWLEHLTGDVHQPLHCISRFLKSMPQGDAGGNYVYLTGPYRNLHSLWDGAAGRDDSEAYIAKYMAEATAAHPAPHHLEEKNPALWIHEGFEVAVAEVYTFGLETGTHEHPITLPDGYKANAAKVAEQRIAIAGYRLAAVLNEKFK